MFRPGTLTQMMYRCTRRAASCRIVNFIHVPKYECVGMLSKLCTYEQSTWTIQEESWLPGLVQSLILQQP